MAELDPTSCEDDCAKLHEANLAACREAHERRLREGIHSQGESEAMLENCIGYYELVISACIEECRQKYYQELAKRQG
jgi:hypothetical protein